MRVPQWGLNETTEVLSPSLLVCPAAIQRNLDQMVRIAGSPDRLRPHCKTHKMVEVARLAIDRGITRHKAATIAEAEMLARAGAADILLAMQPAGPNILRMRRLVSLFPQIAWHVICDDLQIANRLSGVMREAPSGLGVMLDLNVGQDRTGIVAGTAAVKLCVAISQLEGLRFTGFHVYDGHQSQQAFNERTLAVTAEMGQVWKLKRELETLGVAVPQLVCGGTGTFPVFATMPQPDVQLSPGTCVLHDGNYDRKFPDLSFEPAALLLGRVVSKPGPNLLTCDLGYKAVSADQPAGQRLDFPELPDAIELKHNEEHLVLSTPRATEIEVGATLLAVPRHICPTVALFNEAYVVENNQVTGTWVVAARGRRLTV